MAQRLLMLCKQPSRRHSHGLSGHFQALTGKTILHVNGNARLQFEIFKDTRMPKEFGRSSEDWWQFEDTCKCLKNFVMLSSSSSMAWTSQTQPLLSFSQNFCVPPCFPLLSSPPLLAMNSSPRFSSVNPLPLLWDLSKLHQAQCSSPLCSVLPNPLYWRLAGIVAFPLESTPFASST